MAVMVTFTLKADAGTYRAMHPQMLPAAMSAGLLFHSAYEVGNEIAIVDFWPSAETWDAFSEGPLAGGMKEAGIQPPDDLKVTPVLDADSR
jgi:hypothetical protein